MEKKKVILITVLVGIDKLSFCVSAMQQKQQLNIHIGLGLCMCICICYKYIDAYVAL